MRNPGGYGMIIESGVITSEHDTFTCCHCNSVHRVKPKERPEDLGGWCRLCAKPTCPGCADGACVPFEKKLDAIENSRRARASYGI